MAELYGLLLLNAIVPFVAVLVGFLLKKCPAADRESQNGYNTPVSRKSQRHWDYAQKIAPVIFVAMGKWLFVVEAIISVIFLVLGVSAVISVITGTGIGFAALIGTFFYTDSKIEEFVKNVPE